MMPWSCDDVVLGSSHGPADDITLGIDEETELGSMVGSFDGFNEGKLVGSLLGESLGLDNGTVPR